MKPIPNEEERLLEQHLFREEPDADFTLEVMQKLEDVSMVSGEDELQPTKASQKKWFRRTGMAAAVILLLGGAWFAWEQNVMPTKPGVSAVNPPLPNIPVPESLRYFNLTDDYKRLQPLGLYVNPQIEIENEGYTLKIHHVLVDRSQIVMTIEQIAPDGTNAYLISPYDYKVHITDEKGRQAATFVKETNLYQSGYQRWVFQLNDDIPDQVVVRGELESLIAEKAYHEPDDLSKNTLVDWSFQFNLDMTKAKALSIQTPLKDTYTTPEGLQIGLTQMIRTPNGIRLDLDVSLSDELQAKVEAGWDEELEILYHLEIPDTKEYRIFNGSRSGARQAKFRLKDLSQLSGTEGHIQLSEVWDPAYVTLDAKHIRFVLDGYTIPVKQETLMEIDLNHIDSKPVKIQKSNAEIKIDSYSFIPAQNSSNLNKNGRHEASSLLVLEGSAILNYDAEYYEEEHWILTDAEGDIYPFEPSGSEIRMNEKGQAVMDELKISVQGFDLTKGTKLTIKRMINKQDFDDVDWTVDLPSYRSLPWQQ
ncbi:hypothetical protein ASD24_22650 [Paenibacillus sp. Root52]|uniref:DUF4179 domain-containing protein n=1 Tax=Paenibacillus sp. Root52 TaxID=1736552 RepID=UPI0006F83F9C|nr:DUF4179 domain-containing protein [Paenibacillus sp. Root52]KQY91544.1 hypothetical protein ASD24_22650 [Paenibacillus sp. Root52]